MTTETDVCNLALSHVGTRATIASLAENSPEARACSRFFAHCRDEALAATWWGFARATATLTLLKAAPGTPEFSGSIVPLWTDSYPAPPWQYEYAYPANCIKARYVVPSNSNGTLSIPIFSVPLEAGVFVNGAAVRFNTAQGKDLSNNPIRVILTNQANAILTYTAQTTDLNLWSKDAIMALSLVLAAYITPTLSGDKKLQANLFASARDRVTTAEVKDANEGLTIQDSTPDWMSIRGQTNIGDLTFGTWGGSYVS